MVSITKKKVKIYVADADTNVSELASGDVLKGEIMEYSLSDFDQEFDTEDVFGGQVEVIKPRGQGSLEFTIRPQTEHAGRWEELSFGSKTVNNVDVYTPALAGKEVLVVISVEDGDDPSVWAFNKVKNVTFNFSHSADEAREGTLNFNVSPETSDGLMNSAYINGVIGDFPDWSELTLDD